MSVLCWCLLCHCSGLRTRPRYVPRAVRLEAKARLLAAAIRPLPYLRFFLSEKRSTPSSSLSPPSSSCGRRENCVDRLLRAAIALEPKQREGLVVLGVVLGQFGKVIPLRLVLEPHVLGNVRGLARTLAVLYQLMGHRPPRHRRFRHYPGIKRSLFLRADTRRWTDDLPASVHPTTSSHDCRYD